LKNSFPDMPMAEFSPCRRYRYFLKRSWDSLFPSGRLAAFLLLNPSTANEVSNDNTVTRCIGFAKAWGYSGLFIINLFAFRATNPAAMLSAKDPVGPENDVWIERAGGLADIVVAAWGNNGSHLGRSTVVQKKFQEMGIGLQCLSVTGAGQPEHPLYLKSNLSPQPFPG